MTNTEHFPHSYRPRGQNQDQEINNMLLNVASSLIVLLGESGRFLVVVNKIGFYPLRCVLCGKISSLCHGGAGNLSVGWSTGS